MLQFDSKVYDLVLLSLKNRMTYLPTTYNFKVDLSLKGSDIKIFYMSLPSKVTEYFSTKSAITFLCGLKRNESLFL